MASSVLATASSRAGPRPTGPSRLDRHLAELDALKPKCSGDSDLVPVLMLFCDDEAYCKTYLPSLMHATAIGLAHYGFRPRFYFYDNSSDGTPQCLATVAKTFDVRWCSEPLPEHVPRGGAARSSARCGRIALCRNALMGMAAADIQRARLVLMVDSNIFAGAGAVMELVRTALADPAVGLATACSRSAASPKHYYDTYAFWPCGLPENASVMGNFCPMRECSDRNCQFRTRARFATLSWSDVRPMQVWSAFGGMAVARPEAMLAARWSSKFDQCEHIAFCRDIRAHGYNIVVVPTATAAWVQHMDRAAPARLRQLHREIRARPDLQVVEKMWSWREPKAQRDGEPRGPGRVAAGTAQKPAAPPRRSVPAAHGRVRVSRLRHAPR